MTISFRELRDVTPPHLPFDHIAAFHSAVVLRNALGMGAFEKVADGVRQCRAALPSERAFLPAQTLRGLPFHVWLNGVRDQLPSPAIRRILQLKRRLRGQGRGGA